MNKPKETFASTLECFQWKYDLHKVFDDFLTMSICAVTRNPVTGLSHYEDLYLETIKPYKNDELRFQFPKMFALLVAEIEALVGTCNDVLGTYYEAHFLKKGTQQFFTPWNICMFMAKSSFETVEHPEEQEPIRILEPACGSGRMLLAASQVSGKHHHFYGVDIDATCVKMTALNLFLNGLFHSEVACCNFLMPDDFRFSYRLSFLPLGIFRIEEKEQSPLWHSIRLQGNGKQESRKGKEPLQVQADISNLKLPSDEGNQEGYNQQLQLF